MSITKVGVVGCGLMGAGITEVCALRRGRPRPHPGRGRPRDLSDRQLVVEAVVEDESAKVSLFTELDRILADPDTILASNTSSIPIMKHGVVTSRPEKVISIHFFNPVPVLQLVELVPSLLTSPDTTDRARALVEGPLAKQADQLPGPGGLRGQRAPHPVRALRDPDARVRHRDR